MIENSNRSLTALMRGYYGGALAAGPVLTVGRCTLAWFGDTDRRKSR